MTRVLVVDDNPANRALLEVLFRRHGASVDAADGVQAAIESAAHALPDLVVVDLQMPFVDGHDTAEILRRLPGLGEVPIVAVSAADVKDLPIGEPFAAFFPLPLEVEQFASDVLALVRAP